jgi:hypothetical protein
MRQMGAGEFSQRPRPLLPLKNYVETCRKMPGLYNPEFLRHRKLSLPQLVVYGKTFDLRVDFFAKFLNSNLELKP